MAFHFKRKESVASGVRRMCHELHDEAAKCLNHDRKGRTAHCIRKDIKKSRAVLRLVRQAMPKKAFRREIDLLGRSAQELSAVRDAHAALKTLEGLQSHFGSELPAAPFSHTMAALEYELKTAAEDFAKRKSRRKIKRHYDQFARLVDDSRFRCKEWKAISRDLQDRFRRACQSHELACERPLPANLHEWRKRTKDVWYFLRLLRKANPVQLDPLANEFKRLGECLGTDHDLWALNRMAQIDGRANSGELKLLRQLIRRRRLELREDAFELGKKLFVEKPDVFQERMAAFWKAWRNK